MDEILRITLTVSGSLSIMVAGIYAALRVIRQDKQWEKLILAKDAEIARLRRLLKSKDEEDADAAGVDKPGT